jgi:hypothetical protein
MMHSTLHWACSAVALLDVSDVPSLQANEAAPDAVKAAHAEYIAAGCRCITTNNFVATRYSLAKVQREADVARLTLVRRMCMCWFSYPHPSSLSSTLPGVSSVTSRLHHITISMQQASTLACACYGGGLLLQLAGQLARQAVQDSGQEGVLVAGSLPPLQER